jgi:hypothetical protein
MVKPEAKAIQGRLYNDDDLLLCSSREQRDWKDDRVEKETPEKLLDDVVRIQTKDCQALHCQICVHIACVLEY